MSKPKRQSAPKALHESTAAVVYDPSLVGRGNDWLRHEAKIAYTTNPNGITVEDLHAQEKFGVVSIETLRRWSREDGWTEARKEILAGWADEVRARLQEEIAGRLAQQQRAELEDLEFIRKDLLSKLTDTPAKTAEGVVKALVDLYRYRGEVSNSLAERFLPDFADKPADGEDDDDPKKPTGKVDVQLSDQELRELSRQILLKRRAERAISAEVEPPEVDGNGS